MAFTLLRFKRERKEKMKMKMKMGNTILNPAFILSLLWSVLLLEHNNVIAAQPLSRKVGRQLQHSNKPAILTIQTIRGDTYDCVDFYKQPAFDHPLLRNHTFSFQTNYSHLDLEGRTTNSSSFTSKLSDIWLNGKGCPIGTVPIRRTTKHDLLKVNSIAEAASSGLNAGVHVAILRSTGNKKYYGGGMSVTVYKPTVQGKQYSSSRMKFANGPDSIAMGWTVNPSLYQDNESHLFIYTITKDSHCYNAFCPGFVIMSHAIPLDAFFQPVSQRGGAIYVERFFIRKEPVTGGWLLVVGADNTVVGVWPKEIFTGLSDFANYAEWGGEVYSPYGVSHPPMGSGCRPVQDTKKDGYAKQVTVIDENGKVDYDPLDLETYADDPDRYTAIDQYNLGGNFQYLVEFGGNHCLAGCDQLEYKELSVCAN